MNCSLYQQLNIKLIAYKTTELICSFVLEDLSYKKPRTRIPFQNIPLELDLLVTCLIYVSIKLNKKQGYHKMVILY